MARIKGIEINDKKNVVFALTKIFGIGFQKSKKIIKKADVNLDLKFGKLSEVEINRIRKLINSEISEGDLRRNIHVNIKRLIEIHSYRGMRHKKKLPTRGQRTRSNARTRKGKKKTVANKKKATKL